MPTLMKCKQICMDVQRQLLEQFSGSQVAFGMSGLGTIPVSSDTVESEGLHVKQCLMKYFRKSKIIPPVTEQFLEYGRTSFLKMIFRIIECFHRTKQQLYIYFLH